jgi:3-oxoacyl-[acyl-carrier protein] reductase
MKYDGIAGKVAIVTGAGGGIGEADARALAEQGARLVIAEIDKDKGEAVAASLRDAGHEARYVEVDVGSPESTQAMAEHVIAAYGGIDFLVNNAAIFGGMKMQGARGDWDITQVHERNTNGALLYARTLDAKRGGGAIATSRQRGWMGEFTGSLARHEWSHAAARELGSMKIRVPSRRARPTDALAKQVPRPSSRWSRSARSRGWYPGHEERVFFPLFDMPSRPARSSPWTADRSSGVGGHGAP